MQSFSLLNGAIAGVRWGQGTRRLLAFHGLLDNALSFQRLAEQLPDIEIWAIDLPGHGLSQALPQTDGMFLLHWLPTLGRLLDELAWSDYEILGHSLGAILSQLLATVDPRIRALYSLDALGPLASSERENFRRLERLYQARHKTVPVRQYTDYEQLVASRLRGTFPLSPRAAAVMAKRAVTLTRDGWQHRYDRRLRHESIWRLSEAEVQSLLRQIRCPVYLALFQAQHWDGYQSVFQARSEVVPTLSVTPMAGSHHLHLEQPERVAAWLRTVLLQ